jgi:hypothetical protein
MSDREIYSHSGSLASLVSDLKNGQRGIDADSGDWLYKDYAGVIHAARSYKSYSGSVWNYNAIPTGLTGNRGLVTDSSGNLAASAVTSTELGYLSGVTSSIQTQLNGKLSGSGTTGRIPYFTSGSALGNSNLYFGGKSVRLMAAPSNWGTNFATIELGLNAIWANYGVQNGFGLTFSNNIYHDGTGNKPYVDGEALSYDQDGGIHTWYVDTGLIAGVAFTPTERMQLNTAGLKLSNINPSAALVSDANRVISSSSVTSTELGLLSGRTSLLGGSGTADYIPRFSNSGTLANSTIRYVDFGSSARESLWIGGRSSVTFYKDSGAGGSLTWEHNIGRNSDGTTYARSSGTASCFSNTGDTFYWYYDTGLTGGVDFTPTVRMQLDFNGLFLQSLNASRAVVTNSSGYLMSSAVTLTELNLLSGKTGLIGGSGTAGQFPIFTASGSVGDSYFSYIAGSSTYLWATASIAELMSLTPEHLWINTKMVCNGLSTGDNSTISTTSSSYSIDISTLTQYNIKFTSTVNSSVMLWKANVGDIIYLTNVGTTQVSIKYDGESGGPAKELYPGQTMMLMCFNTYGYNNWYSTWAIWRTDTNPSSHLND